MDRRRALLLATLFLTVCLRSHAIAESSGVTLDVSPSQRNFIRRYALDNNIEAKADVVSNHLAVRIVRELQIVFPMFDFAVKQPALLEVIINTGGAAKWPDVDLVLLVRTPRSPTHFIQGTRFLERCENYSGCTNLNDDGWIRRVIVDAVRAWNTIAPAITEIPIRNPVKHRDGLAVAANRKPHQLYVSGRALFQTRGTIGQSPVEATFVLCTQDADGNAAGPFLSQTQHSDAERLLCTRTPIKPAKSEWSEFYLMRLWP